MEPNWRTTIDDRGAPAIRAAIANSAPVVPCLLPALALGAALPFVTSLPAIWAVLVCLAICGGLAVVLMFSISLPLAPILRLLLLTTLWFRMEINLFPILKNHADPVGVNVSLAMVVSLSLGALWLMNRRRGNEREPVLPIAFTLTLIGILLWLSLSVAYGAEGMLGVYGIWSTAASMLMCFVVAAHFSDRRALYQALVAIAVLVALNSLFGLAQTLFPSLSDVSIGSRMQEDPAVVEGEEVSRVYGLSGTSNMFAWVLVTFLPIVIAPLLLRVTSLRHWRRALCLAAAGVAVVALILTYSRGSWVAFIVSAVLMAVSALFILKADERKRLILRFAGVAALIGLLAIPFSGKIISRLVDDDRGAAEVRLPLIEVALGMIADNPVLGVGLGSYESVMRKYDETQALVTEHFDWPVHNSYLYIAAETGLPGLLLFLLLVMMASRRGWMVLRDPSADPMMRAMALGLLTGMAAYLITALKEGGCFQTSSTRSFYLICGLLIANERASRRVTE